MSSLGFRQDTCCDLCGTTTVNSDLCWEHKGWGWLYELNPAHRSAVALQTRANEAENAAIFNWRSL